MIQLRLIPYDHLSQTEMLTLCAEIRRDYWHIRNSRTGRFSQARLRKYYRAVQARKLKLLLAGVEKRDLLDFIACCRLQCSSTKQPFHPCRYCSRYQLDQVPPVCGTHTR